MAWTTPMTAVDGDILTAAVYNATVRDNLLETMPAKAVPGGGFFLTSGLNSISLRTAASARENTTGTRSSTSYGNAGPEVSVSLTTGPSALVLFMVEMGSDSLNSTSMASVEVSGSTSIAASDSWAIIQDGRAASNYSRCLGTHRFSGLLTPGSNTFTLKFRVGSNSATFDTRELVVIPI